MGNPRLIRIVFEYSNGKKYVLEGDKLELFNDYLIKALHSMIIRKEDITPWNNLMKKILKQVGFNID